MTALLLGGTGEARALATVLVERGVRVVSSLAGRVSNPRLPDGEVRVGGFGGPEGLAVWLAEHRAVVVDATHPFATGIGTSAVVAARLAGTELLRLERPGWQQRHGDRWQWVDSLDEAAAALGEHGERVLLTSGRQGISAFADRAENWFLARCVDPPDPPLPPRLEILLDRGPYHVETETALLRDRHIDVLVTKNSGGTMTAPKLTAARELGLPVLMVRRPPRPQAHTVSEVDQARDWVLARTNRS